MNKPEPQGLELTALAALDEITRLNGVVAAAQEKNVKLNQQLRDVATETIRTGVWLTVYTRLNEAAVKAIDTLKDELVAKASAVEVERQALTARVIELEDLLDHEWTEITNVVGSLPSGNGFAVLDRDKGTDNQVTVLLPCSYVRQFHSSYVGYWWIPVPERKTPDEQPALDATTSDSVPF